MAAFNRPTEATYEIHEKVTVDTKDNEDHTFCGIMFPVKCKDLLPIDHLIIKSVAVRGKLGPLTVWISNENAAAPSGGNNNNNNNNQSEHRFRLNPKYWTKVYEKTHKASFHTYKTLELDTPIRMEPGQVRAIYIHSTLSGDEAIVYDNSYYGVTAKRYDDSKLAIMTGRAHVSTRVFGQDPIWGYGNAWRDRREFVGKLDYGVVYKLWNPQVQPKFGKHFQDGARLLFLCQRRWESPLSRLPDECIFYILNMCRWDWFHDSPTDMQERRKQEKLRLRQLRERAAVARQQQQLLEQQQQDSVATMTATVTAVPVAEQKPSASTTMVVSTGCGGCRGRSAVLEEDEQMNDVPDDTMEEDDDDDDDDDDDYVDADDVEEVDAEEEEVDSDAWSDEEDQYYRANHHAFTYRDVDSDDDGAAEDEDQGEMHSRSDWIRRQFARIHVLRALASMEDGATAAHVHVQL